MARTFRDTLATQLKDPEFKAEWDALEPEYQVVRAMLESREATGITQGELSRRSGVSQADISRLEHATGNPSLRTLKRLASAMGMTLEVRFVPQQV